jgi:hypothetical protein
MSNLALRVVLDACFRANPQYELIVFDRLPPEQQELLRNLTQDPDFYGVLLPKQAGGSIKSICRDAALLYLTLSNPGSLPGYARTMFGERSNQEIAELVLDEVLEIEYEGSFVCGAGAYDLVYGEQPAQAARAGLPQLTLDALQYAQLLDLDDTGPISARLYFYNRTPLSPRWARQFPRTEAVAAHLGIDTGGANLPRLDARWSKVELEPPMNAWFQWKFKHARAPGQKTGQTFKLYISPQPEFVRRAFEAVLETLSQSGTAPQFKVGNDAAGLLRPDKMVAYFWSFDALRAAADRIAELLKGCPAQGVPFTAAITEDGLLSWGIDPRREKGAMAWMEQESWRLWVTNRLAAALVTAKRAPNGGVEPWQFALERLRLEGVDTLTWTPSDSFGRAAEKDA